MPRCSTDAQIALHFATACEDVTPPDLQGEVRVLHLLGPGGDRMTGLCAAVLSDAERQRAATFAKPDDAARFVQRRAFRRFCGAVALGCTEALSTITFAETPKGSPHLPTAPEHRFSFSSCRSGMIGAWSATCSVGVDLEDRTENVDAIDIANRFFTKAEASDVRSAPEPLRLRTFLRIWCLKEAALKSIGEGLSFGPQVFEVGLEPKLRLTSAPGCHGGVASFEAWHLVRTQACGVLVTHRRA